ncbi:XRE family transcriptional regulator [Deltaproteobacteria bacterium Smac51]|nr:XRE family transcriptional regulator [Deltaproteobacteria bacterium Smac51]
MTPVEKNHPVAVDNEKANNQPFVPGAKSINDSRYIIIGLRVAYYRKLNGLTQQQLAEKINLSPRYLSMIETSSIVQPISLKTLFAFADAFDIRPGKFLEP